MKPCSHSRLCIYYTQHNLFRLLPVKHIIKSQGISVVISFLKPNIVAAKIQIDATHLLTVINFYPINFLNIFLILYLQKLGLDLHSYVDLTYYPPLVQ